MKKSDSVNNEKLTTNNLGSQTIFVVGTNSIRPRYHWSEWTNAIRPYIVIPQKMQKNYNLKKNFIRYLFYFSLLIINFSLLISCYTFRGASLDPNLKTIQIQNFQFQTAGGPPNLSLQFNEKLKEYFQRNTSLKTTNINPDLMFEGAIIGFTVEPKAASSDDKGGLNRLTIIIQVKFTNAKNDEKSYDQEFSFYQDFAQTQTITAVQGELVPKILDQIVLDIFNKTAGEW